MSNDRRGFSGESIFWQFPNDLLPAHVNTNESLSKAVLFYHGCEEVETTGVLLFDVLIQRKSHHCQDPVGDGHLIHRLTLVNGEVMVLDITGHQFGWQQTLYTWSAYQKNKIHNFVSVDKRGQVEKDSDTFRARWPPHSIPPD